jgi:sugar lactone lactonase YvrE
MKSFTLFLLIVILTLSCKSRQSSEQATDFTFELVKLWETDTVFRTPESVRFHPDKNILFVSNINNVPDSDIPNGFISTMDTEGEIMDLKWVTGLKGPKGMAIYENTLYVADVDQLVLINIEEASIISVIPVDGASFLNDAAVDDNGKVYFSDSNTGKVHVYENGEISEWITEGLKRPNGLYVEKDRILMVSAESQDLKIINPETAEYEVVLTEIGRGDGIEFTGYDGYYISTDWQGEIFLIHPDFTKQSLLSTKEDKKNTADIGLNPAEHIVYVPTFFDNKVVAYKLERK